MAEPKKRTLQGVYEGLKQISQDEGVDFGIDNYTYEQFRDKYKTPKDLLALYNNLSDISDESGLDFGIGSQNEWLGSFGDGWNEGGGQPRAVIQNADSYGLMPEAVEREKARKAGMYLPFATPEAAEEYRRERKTTAARKASTTEKPSVQNRWMPQTPYQSMEGAGGPAMPIEKLPGYQEEKAEYEKAMQKATSLMQTQRKVQKELSRGQVGELELSIDEQLAAAKKRDEDAAGLSDKSLWQKLVDPLKSGMGVEITTNQDILNNPEGRLEYGQDVRDLQAAKRMITDAKRMIAEADHNAKEGTYESSFIAGIGRGFRQKFSDVSTWDMGVTDITDNSAIFDALNAYEEGRLTPSQQTLLDAKVIELAVNEYFGSELGRGYKAGQVTAESLPFMIEMIANPIAGTGKGASKLMAKYALKRFAKKEMKKGASKLAAEETAKKLMVKDGKKYVSSQIMKGAARVGGDIAGATGMTATTGLGRTAADAIERMSGTPLWEIDDEGNTVMTGVKKGEDPATAWRKAFLNTTIENYSEMLGAYFAPITEGLGKGLQKLATSKGGSKIGLNKVGDFIENVKTKDLYKIVSDFEEHANWHGGIGEFGEEIAGGILNSLLVGDQSIRGKDGKIWNSSDPNALFNQDNLIDTGLGVGVLSVVFPFIKTVGYRSPRIQAKRELKEADDAGLKLWGGNQYEWGGIRNTLAFGNVEDVKNKIREVFSNPDVTEEQKKAVWDYAIKAQAYKGVENFEEKWDKDPESDPAQVAAVDTYEKAYEDITTPESRREQYIMYKDARERLNELVGDDMMARIDEAPLSINAAWQSSLDIDENMREALSRYIATKASVDGIEDRINDDADEYADQQREEAKKQSFNADGSERPVEMKDGNTVYLKEGNIAVTEDGTIDVENSDQMVTVYDPKQGKNVPISPEDIKSLGEVRSAEDVEAGIERSRAEMVQSQLDEAQNKITVGTTFQTKEGVEAQVVAINGDDIIYMTADGQQGTMPLQETQQLVDAMALESFEKENEGVENGERKTENEEPRAETNSAMESTAYQEGVPEKIEENMRVKIEGEDGQLNDATILGRFAYDAVNGYYEDPQGRFIGYTVDGEYEPRTIHENDIKSKIKGYYKENEETLPKEEPAEGTEEEPQAVGKEASAEQDKGNALEDEGEPVGGGDEMPMLQSGKGKGKNPDFMAVEPERSHRYIYGEESGLTKDEADQFVGAQIAAAKNVMAGKGRKKPPKMGTDLDKYRKEKAAYEKLMDATRSTLEYWEGVKAIQDGIEQAEIQRKNEEAKRAQAEERKRLEAEAAAQKAKEEEEQRKRNAELESVQDIGNDNTVDWPIEEDAEAMEIMNDTEPRTMEEVAAGVLASGKYRLIPSETRSHTGYGSADFKKMPFIFAGADKGGISPEHMGEIIENEARNENVKFDESDNNVGFNALLNVLSEVSTMGDLKNYIANRRKAQAEDIHSDNVRRMAEAKAEDEWIVQHGGMERNEYNNYIAWVEDAVEQGKRAITDEEYNQLFNTDYDTRTTTIDEGGDQRGTEESGADEPEAGQAADTENDTRRDGEETAGERVADNGAIAEQETTADGNDGRGDSRRSGERQDSVPQAEITAPLSDEVNEYGKPFVLASDGTTTFGEVSSESGLTAAPIKLSIGENRVDKDGNHGYGVLHIEAGHGDQIRAAGFNSIEEFVETVAKNYDTIREGGVVANNQTYLLEISDEHNNTLFIQLSKDGKYWNVNSAGIFKKKYSRRKPEVYTRPAVESGTDTDTSEVNRGQSEGVTATSRNSSQLSGGKGTNISETGKKNVVNTSETKTTKLTKQQKAEVLFYDNLEYINDEYGTNYYWPSLKSFLSWANKKAKAKKQPIYTFVKNWFVDKLGPKDGKEVVDVIFDALKAKQQPKAQKTGGEAGKTSKRDRGLLEVVMEKLRNIIGDRLHTTLSEDEKRMINWARAAYHRVFHGSGADFERFDSSHMGEGEGMQAYGYGHYTTEVEGIGRTYAKATSDKNLGNRPAYIGARYDYFYKGQPIDQDKVNPLQLACGVAIDSKTIAEARRRADRYADIAEYSDNAEMAEKWREAYRILSESKKSDFTEKPHKPDYFLYTVEIPDDNGSNYLEWDKPISDEDMGVIRVELEKKLLADDEYFKERYKGHENDLIANLTQSLPNGSTGRDVYETISQYLTEKGASEFLHDMGYVGIKYPAEYRSGGREDNAKNYVIFDDGDLKIVDKIKFFKTPQGEVYGFTVGGNIYVDMDIAKADTPIHEYGHLWVPMVRESDPEMWEDIKRVLTKDKDVKPFMDIVRQRYPELTAEGREDDFMEEVFTHFSGDNGLKILEEAAREYEEQDGNGIISKAKAIAALNKVKEALDKFWGKVAELFGIKFRNAREVANKMLKDFMDEVDPTKVRREATEAIDKKYMEAVKKGDRKTERQMVAEASEKAMPDSKIRDKEGKLLVVYHDTNSTRWVNKETGEEWDKLDWQARDEWSERDDWDEYWEEKPFYTFDNESHGRESIEIPGFFFHATRDEHHAYGKREIAAYVNITNPIINPEIPNRGVTNTAGRDAMNQWMAEGYDGMIRSDEDGNWIEVVAFKPNQIKSADPVTYDDAGNVIPLSERFNSRNADIRWQKANAEDITSEENIAHGLDALQQLADGAEEVRGAMKRKDLAQYGGDENITFYFGKEGDASKDYKKGYGIAHIGAKHGKDAIIRAINIIANGQFERYVPGNKTVVLTDGEYETVLALTRFGNKETWLFNGWKKKENTGDNGEVSTASVSTQNSPTFSRADLGAVVSAAKVQQNSETAKNNSQKAENKGKKGGTYRTRDGVQLSMESLFDADAHEDVGEPNESAPANDLSELRLRKLRPGETCLVERRYEENKMFSFTGKERIESMDDVAYIFKQLENAAIENVFVAMIKDGKPTIIHIGMGTYAESVADYRLAFAAYESLKPDKVWMIHNHPSGSLRASRQDRELLQAGKQIFGEKVMQDGIIIDTTSGKYGVFNSFSYNQDEHNIPEGEKGEIPLKTYEFSRQVFSPEWNPYEAFGFGDSRDIAEFISSHRLGEHPKMSFIVTNAQNKVVGNFFLPWTKMSEIGKDLAGASKMLSNYVNLAGGTKGVLFGNYEYDKNEKRTLGKLINEMKTLRTPLLDVLHFDTTDTEGYHSAHDSGVMEPEAGYGTASTAETEQAKREAVEKLGEKLHTDIEIIEDVDKAEGLTERQKKAPGWYNPVTRKVTIVLPNNRDREDAVATVFHETAGHKGMREMIGEERYGEFLDTLYTALKDELKAAVDEKAGRDFQNNIFNEGKGYEYYRRRAVDETIARLAETMPEDMTESEQTLWQKICTLVRKAIDKFLGDLKLPKWVHIGEDEIRYMLWKSRERLENGKESYVDIARDAAKRNELGLDDDIVFRDEEQNEDEKPVERLSLREKMTQTLLEMSAQNEKDNEKREAALKAINANLSDIRKAMGTQRRYDKTTVKRVSDLARILIQYGYLKDLSDGEVKRLLSAEKNATGKEDISGSVQKIMDIMVDNQLKQAEKRLEKLESIKGSKV